jgi:hypothetical protein
MTVPKHSYIVLTEHAHAHHILVRYDDRPDWLQHIGTMRHKDRADSYVEIENSFVDDRTDYGDTVDDIGLPPDLPAEAPPSALPRVYGTTMPAASAENFRVRL